MYRQVELVLIELGNKVRNSLDKESYTSGRQFFEDRFPVSEYSLAYKIRLRTWFQLKRGKLATFLRINATIIKQIFGN